MEPKLPAPNRGPENFPSSFPKTIEYGTPSAPEQGIERRQEQVERKPETGPAATETTQPILPPPVIPALPAPVVTDDNASKPADDVPLVANDDDLIEKEWVDKAKKIITETKDDPYRREQEVGKLQADYLKKRYGKDLGAPN